MRGSRFAPRIVAGVALVLATVGVALALILPGGGGHPSNAKRSGAPRRPAKPRQAPTRPAVQAGASGGTTALQACLNHWNSPGNPTLRIRFASAAREAAAGTPVQNRALVVLYRGAPLGDVGVGTRGVNLAPGDCMVVHPANVLFAFTDGRWHQVGYSPGVPQLADLPVEAAHSPNADVDLGSGIVTLIAGR